MTRTSRRPASPVAVVTGAGRGIGRATAEAFAGEGWAVVVAELRPDLGRRVERALRRAGRVAHFVATDVADAASVTAALRAARARLGRIDCLVNNAGVLEVGPLARLPLAALDRMLAVNLRGPLLGRYGAADYVVYCATKFGVVGLTEALADEVAESGVRVFAVCPGLVDTPLAHRAVGVTPGAPGLIRPEIVARVIVDLSTGRRRAASGTALDVT